MDKSAEIKIGGQNCLTTFNFAHDACFRFFSHLMLLLAMITPLNGLPVTLPHGNFATVTLPLGNFATLS